MKYVFMDSEPNGNIFLIRSLSKFGHELDKPFGITDSSLKKTWWGKIHVWKLWIPGKVHISK